MPESPLVQKETVALAELEALIAARAKGESETELGFRKRIEREEVEYRTAAKQKGDKYKVDNAAMEADYSRAKDQVVQTFQRDTSATKAEYEQTKKQIDEQLKKDSRKAKKSKEETGWQALAMFEGQRDEGIKWRRSTDAAWGEEIGFLHQKQADAEYVLKRCGRLANATLDGATAAAETPAAAPTAEGTPPAEGAAPVAAEGGAETAEPPVEQTPLVELQGLRASLEDHLIGLDALKLPKFLKIDNFIWPWLFLGAAVAAGLGFGTGVGWTIAGIVGGVVAVASGVGAYLGLSSVARPSVAKHSVPLKRGLADAEQLIEQNKDWIKNKFDGKIKELEKKRETMVRDAEDVLARRVTEFQSRNQKQTEEADKTYPARLEQIRVRRDEGLKKADEHFPPRIAALKEKYEKERKELDESYRKTKETTKLHYDQAWSNLIKNWTEGMGRVDQTVNEVRDEAGRRFLEWGLPELDGWKPPVEVPPGMRFGLFDVDLNHFPNGVPVDPRLKSVPTHFQIPALLPFPMQGSVLIKAADAGKDEGIKLLQSLMLRYLTSIPAGKVRFTIVDPVGLGENFAAFMHLGDYHELLVTNRIWTEAQHIEQRLTDLTEHMENVIQKYLRNEFETIEEYNTMAGEVAEPFRILVVANFPTNFNDAALRRLISIVNSGARCGVYALVMLDTSLGHRQVSAQGRGARKPVRQHDLEGEPSSVAPAGFRPLSAHARRSARSGTVLPDSAQGRQRCARRQPGRGSFRVHRPQARPVLDLRQQQGSRHSPGPRRCHQAAALETGQRHVAARPHRRQDGLRQVDDAARAYHQRSVAIQPQPARAVPDRLQERRRVQGVCRDESAARAGHRRRERT